MENGATLGGIPARCEIASFVVTKPTPDRRDANDLARARFAFDLLGYIAASRGTASALRARKCNAGGN